MIKDKRDIQAMINKYMTTKKGINALGFLSYHTFDKELITKDYEAINDFFRENFDLNHCVINYQDLLKDAEGSIWLEINTIFDLELLDELIAFTIASNVTEENLSFRYDESIGQFDLLALINEDPEDLQFYTEEEYLKIMKRRVLPTFKLLISRDTLTRYEKNQIPNDYSDERKKELLISWWDQGMEGKEDEYTRECFLEYLTAPNLNGIINLVYQIYSQNNTSLKLSELIKGGGAYPQIILAGAHYYHCPPERKKKIQEGIKAMFDDLNKTEQKKKRLI